MQVSRYPRVAPSDVLASRPSAANFGVGLFYATDTKVLYRSSGSAWTAVSTGVLAQSAVAIVAPADTTEDVLATIAVPANAMGANGRLRISTDWTCTNNANVKTIRLRFSGASGTVIASEALTSNPALSVPVTLANRNATNSQVGINQRLGYFGVAQTATAAIDTTAATTLVITSQKALATDTITLENYSVELIPA